MANAHPIQVSAETHRQAKMLAAQMSKKLGKSISIGKTVGRALECLRDSQNGGAWLSPSETAKVMEKRFERRTCYVLQQVLDEFTDKRLEQVIFDTNKQVAILVVDGKAKPVFTTDVDAMLSRN